MNELNFIDEKSNEKRIFGAGSMFIDADRGTLYCLTATRWYDKIDKVNFRLVGIEEDHAFVVQGKDIKNELTASSIKHKLTLKEIQTIAKGKFSFLKLKPVTVSINIMS